MWFVSTHLKHQECAGIKFNDAELVMPSCAAKQGVRNQRVQPVSLTSKSQEFQSQSYFEKWCVGVSYLIFDFENSFALQHALSIVKHLVLFYFTTHTYIYNQSNLYIIFFSKENQPTKTFLHQQNHTTNKQITPRITRSVRLVPVVWGFCHCSALHLSRRRLRVQLWCYRRWVIWEERGDTVDGRNPANPLIWRISHFS